MSTAYEFSHPSYFDETDLRSELDRVFELCHGCRLCWNLCPSFAHLFEMIDERTDGVSVRLDGADQDRVVDECYQCKLCYLKCPYVPPHEWELDFPRLMLRATVARRAGRPRLGDRLLAATDAAGIVGTATSRVTNALLRFRPVRAAMEKVGGVASHRVLPPYARKRFSTWWRRRGREHETAGGDPVTLFTTCLVEYNDPSIGKATVSVLRRNGCDVERAETVCCGMPSLDAADVRGFLRKARKNVEVLRDSAASGRTIVVPQPTCAYVLRREYPAYLGTDDARAVAEAVRDPAEYLAGRHAEGTLDTGFTQSLGAVSYHASCHLRAQQVGYKARDLLRLVPETKVTMVEGCSGIDGTWGYRRENYEMAKDIVRPTAAKMQRADADLLVGDCLLSNTALEEEGCPKALHPMQALARAYGIEAD